MPSLRRYVSIELALLLVALSFLALLGFYPQVGFDDVFLKKTDLLPFADFRPGYPPLGKLPYYSAFMFLSQLNLYTVFVLLWNWTALFVLGIILFLLAARLKRERAAYLVLMIVVMPSVLYFTVVYSRADALVLAFAIGALYFIDRPWLSGILIALGTLTKFYPVFLLIPLFIFYKGLRKKAALLYSFVLITLLVSIPFLLKDPLMYYSVVGSHGLRGPSESIFSIIDGYFGHTGFMHPTFDATIYSWQFSTIYQPSSLDHFMYQWKYPFLPYVALGLQLSALTGFGLLARRRKNQNESIMLISLAMFSYFAFSTFYNPTINLVEIGWITLATMNWNRYVQVVTLVSLEVANSFHSIVWFSSIFFFTGTLLPLTLAVIMRTVIYAFIFVNFARRKTI